MQVSTNFAPPFKLIAPFFLLGGLVFLICCLFLFGIEVENITTLNKEVLAWVHLFLLGFVMMVIFGAMAQLVPVVLEVEHFAVELYYIIYPLLFLGAVLMAFGFYYSSMLLPFGGIISLIAFGVFLLETSFTLKKVKKIDFVVSSVIVANLFLLTGLVIGIMLSLGYAGIISFDLHRFLTAHIYFVFIGYVGISIMGMSLVLLPMFWLSHSFGNIWVKSSLGILSAAVICVGTAALIGDKTFNYTGYVLAFISAFLYLVQILIIYKTRARVENDIYLRSMKISFFFFLTAIVLSVFYMARSQDNVLLCLGWCLLGFITFMISGHLYKIIPFLVWYERFSPYVGKKKVPMLADMVPVKSANLQVFFTGLGFLVTGAGFLFQSSDIFQPGLSFLFTGAVFLLKDIIYMIRFKEN